MILRLAASGLNCRMGEVWVVVLVFCACAALSGACSCFPESGPDRFCRYNLIFRGTALAEYREWEEPIDHSDPFWSTNPFSDWVYTVRIDQAIKLPEKLQGAKNLTMRTPTQGSMCGTRFPVDMDVVFFAYINHKKQIQTGLCEPNVPWESLSERDREFLSNGVVDYCANKAEVTPPEP